MTAPARGVIQVHLVRPEDVPAAFVEECLTTTERERAAAFRFPEHAERWSRYRTALRVTLADYLECAPMDVPLSAGPFGKPLLGTPHELHFNLSHNDEIALIAVSSLGPVGIDVEQLKRAKDLPACAETFCHPAELAALPPILSERENALLRIWTAKEAGAKGSGTGFSVSPCDIEVTDSSVIDAKGTVWHLTRLDHPALRDHLAHLCSLQPDATVVILDEPVARRCSAPAS